jgi:hypothetical protein
MTTKVMMLGAEASGKSTLTHQLNALFSSARAGVPADQATIDDPSAINLAPTTGQEMETLTLTDANGKTATVQIKEVGGRIMAVWPKFVKADGTCALIYVVDLSAPHQLATASVAFYDLLSRPEKDVATWPILLFLNKMRNASAMLPETAVRLIGVDRIMANDASVHIRVVAGDTWTGEGLPAVSEWLLQQCR